MFHRIHEQKRMIVDRLNDQYPFSGLVVLGPKSQVAKANRFRGGFRGAIGSAARVQNP
jgi:hypothetical protein